MPGLRGIPEAGDLDSPCDADQLRVHIGDLDVGSRDVLCVVLRYTYIKVIRTRV